MSYKTDNARQIEDQIREDEVEDELRNVTDVLCLQCQRKEYTRVYLANPNKKIISLTIDEPDTFKRMMETTQATNQFSAAGARVELVLR